MPQVAQSLYPYNPLGRANYGDGTSYTNSLDGALGIAGHMAGALSVTPVSPASMNIQVDTGYNLFREGSTGVISGTTTATLLLASPGSLSYWGTVYYDK